MSYPPTEDEDGDDNAPDVDDGYHDDDDCSDLAPTCGGTGYRYCFCGGDRCYCGEYKVECRGCEDCHRDSNPEDYVI